uniref:Putative secreted protein n=1 Tax=Anopheles marajoara TaxID=58244 RepID=A0A2M4CA79_9DIPT
MALLFVMINSFRSVFAMKSSSLTSKAWISSLVGVCNVSGRLNRKISRGLVNRHSLPMKDPTPAFFSISGRNFSTYFSRIIFKDLNSDR